VFRRSRPGVPGFDGVDSLAQLLSQDALADDSEPPPKQLSFDVLALAYHDDVHVGRPVFVERAAQLTQVGTVVGF
jgi:hypothetical protein